MEELVIIHTNDLHSHFENWPKIRRYILKRQAELQAAGITVITLDLGDFSDRVHPLTEATNGLANTLLMNQVNYDGVTIGNNEGVGNSHEQLNDLYQSSEFSVILGNLRDGESLEQPQWAEPYKIIETDQGTRVGLLGLTAPFELTYGPNGWKVAEADEVLPNLLAEISKETDMIVLLSHLGIKEETRIAKAYPEIDIVLGSHTHHLLTEGMYVDECLLAAAGKYGRYIGEVKVQLAEGQIVKKEAEVIPVTSLAEELSDQAEIISYENRGRELLQKQLIADLPQTLSLTGEGTSDIMMMALTAMSEYSQTEVSLLNSGLLLESFQKGLVSRDDLHQVLPHPMHLIRVKISGEHLKAFLREINIQEDKLQDFAIIGMGFRGKVFGQLASNGLTWNDQQGMTYLGQEIEDDKEYQFTTVDHLLFIPFFPSLSQGAEIEFLFPEFLREVIGLHLTRHYPRK